MKWWNSILISVARHLNCSCTIITQRHPHSIFRQIGIQCIHYSTNTRDLTLFLHSVHIRILIFVKNCYLGDISLWSCETIPRCFRSIRSRWPDQHNLKLHREYWKQTLFLIFIDYTNYMYVIYLCDIFVWYIYNVDFWSHNLLYNVSQKSYY